MNRIREKYDSPEIDKFRLYFGIGLALFFAPIFYTFQYVLREIFRLIFTSERHDVWLLSEEEVFFYNWFFAALALIIGQAIGVAYIFESPKKFLKGRLNKRNSILNDQRILPYSFLMWFLKLGVVYALLLGYGGFHFFSIYPYLNFPLILVLIVLFFHSWNTIRLKFKGKSYKWMLVSFFGILGLSTIIAKIDVVDYRAVNESLLKLNMEHTYDLQLPSASYSTLFDHHYFTTVEYDVVIDQKKSQTLLIKQDDLLRPMFNNEGEVSMPTSWHDSNPNGFPITAAFLRVDKRIPYNKICQLLTELRDNDILFPSFAVIPDNSPHILSIQSNYGVPGPIMFFYTDSSEFLDAMDTYKLYNNQIYIDHHHPGSCLINNKPTQFDSVEEELFNLIMSDPDFIIYYDFNNKLALDEYVQIKSKIVGAVNHLRDSYSWDKYGEPYGDLDYYSKEYVTDSFPMRIIELPVFFIDH